MTEEEFTQAILERLPQIVDLDWDYMFPPGRASTPLRNSVVRLYEDGFTIQDAVKFMRCFEDINPELDEDIALRKMNSLKEKYHRMRGVLVHAIT